MTTADIPDVAQVLRSMGHRATPQRLAIYEALWQAGSHPTVEEIHHFIEKRDPTISRATIYKTLQLFVELGLALEIGFRDESTRYDPSLMVHINAICDICGNVEDFPVKELERIISTLEKELDFLVKRQTFNVYGICSRCKKKQTGH